MFFMGYRVTFLSPKGDVKNQCKAPMFWSLPRDLVNVYVLKSNVLLLLLHKLNDIFT